MIRLNQLQIGTSMSKKGNEGSEMPDFLISQQKTTVANFTVKTIFWLIC